MKRKVKKKIEIEQIYKRKKKKISHIRPSRTTPLPFIFLMKRELHLKISHQGIQEFEATTGNLLIKQNNPHEYF